jgi:hypothetical protein
MTIGLTGSQSLRSPGEWRSPCATNRRFCPAGSCCSRLLLATCAAKRNADRTDALRAEEFPSDDCSTFACICGRRGIECGRCVRRCLVPKFDELYSAFDRFVRSSDSVKISCGRTSQSGFVRNELILVRFWARPILCATPPDRCHGCKAMACRVSGRILATIQLISGKAAAIRAAVEAGFDRRLVGFAHDRCATSASFYLLVMLITHIVRFH